MLSSPFASFQPHPALTASEKNPSERGQSRFGLMTAQKSLLVSVQVGISEEE